MNENNKIDFAKVETLESGFSKVSDGTKWGCIDESARIIIPIRYDTIEFRQYDCGPQIVCGRSGVLLTGTRELGFYEKNTIYTGVYDLFDMDGTLLLGGFDDYLFDSISRLYHFFFGRSWTIIANSTGKCNRTFYCMKSSSSSKISLTAIVSRSVQASR